jgi:CBS domain-containing protein
MCILSPEKRNTDTMGMNIQVKDLMTRNVIAVQENEQLTEVLDIINAEHVRHVPVLRGNQLVGIVSRTDINRLTFGALLPEQDSADEAILNMLTLKQIMSANPRVVKASDPISKVAEIFANEEFHALPVVDDQEEWQCVGIITTTDLIRYMSKLL